MHDEVAEKVAARTAPCGRGSVSGCTARPPILSRDRRERFFEFFSNVIDGSLATLDEVIDHYAGGGRHEHPNKSRILHAFSMSDGDKRDLIEFLKSLSDEELLHDPRWSDPWPAIP